MKILLLGKRFGSGIDSILEDFGRQVRLAESLVKLGHEVHLVAADYIKKQSFEHTLHGVKITVTPFGFFYLPNYLSNLRERIRKGNYDAIIASSDPIFGVLAYISNAKTNIIYDVQDNYLTYSSYNFPLIKILEKKMMRKAAFVTVVSKALADKIKHYNKKVILIENGIDFNRIKPIDKIKARKKNNLPVKAKIIGYGARYVDKAQKAPIDFLIKCYNLLKKRHKNLYLLLIGEGNPSRVRKEKDNSGIIAFESVKYSKLMELLSSTDVLVIPYTLTPFTRYSFPYKLPEYMAFSKPVVCPDIGEMKRLLNRTSQLIFKHNDGNDFIKKIESAFKIKRVNYSNQLKNLTWGAIAKKLSKGMELYLK